MLGIQEESGTKMYVMGMGMFWYMSEGLPEQ